MTPLLDTQSIVQRKLHAWLDGGPPKALLWGNPFSGKSSICRQFVSTRNAGLRVGWVPLGVRWGTSSELTAIRAIHDVLRGQSRSSERDQYNLLAGIRSSLWTSSKTAQPIVLVIDGIDNCRDLGVLDEYLNALPEHRILLSVSGNRDKARTWQERLAWEDTETELIDVPDLSSEIAALPSWLRQVNASASLSAYLTDWITPRNCNTGVVALLAEALAPLRTEDIAAILGVSERTAEAGLLDLESDHGPIERDETTNAWLFRHDILAECFRQSFPQSVKDARKSIITAASALVNAVITGERERDQHHYLVRYGSAHGKIDGSVDCLASCTEPAWCLSGAPVPGFFAFADAHYARESAAEQLRTEVESHGAARPESLRVLTRAVLAQGGLTQLRSDAIRDGAKTQDTHSRELTTEAAKTCALLRLSTQLTGAQRDQVQELALTACLGRDAVGVNDFLSAARVYQIPHCASSLDRLVAWIAEQGQDALTELDVLAALELAQVTRGQVRTMLLSQSNLSVRRDLKRFPIHEILCHAVRLSSLSLEDWIQAIIAEQFTREAFSTFMKLRIPQDWPSAAEFAQRLYERAGEIRSETLRLLLLVHALEIPTTADWQSAARVSALELWAEQAFELTAAPWIAPLLLKGLSDPELIRMVHEGNSAVRAEVVGALVQRGHVDLAIQTVLNLEPAKRLSRLALLAMAVREVAPGRFIEVRNLVRGLFRTPGESPSALLIGHPEILVHLVEPEDAISVASDLGEYNRILALGHLIPYLPEVLAKKATAQLVELYADEEDAEALHATLPCARWMSPLDALWLFSSNLIHDWMHMGRLIGAFEGNTSLGQLAPLIPRFAGPKGVLAVAQEISESPWLDRKPLH